MEPTPWIFFVVAVAGWLNCRQQAVVDYLREENRVLREHWGNRRLRCTDPERRRLARKANAPGRRLLSALATLVTPDTLLDGDTQSRREEIRWIDEARARAAPGRPRRGDAHPPSGSYAQYARSVWIG